MRLKSIHVSKYKNLEDFSLRFENESFLDLFVGKNGTGKSNFFEAMLAIFDHLYDLDRSPPAFDYKVTYVIEDEDVAIQWSQGNLQINGSPRRTLGRTPIPENVLIYYSGHNEIVGSKVSHYEQRFQSRLKGADFKESPRFIGIGPDFKELLLSVLLLQSDQSKARQFILSKLGISEVSQTVRITLKRPFFAGRNVGIDRFEEKTHFWGTAGITREFLVELQKCIRGAFTHNDLYQPETDTYVLDLDRTLIEKQFSANAPRMLRGLHNLKILEMLGGISIPMSLNGKVRADVDFFSDGQFQSVYIYTIVELFKDRNCLTLLDEPDSFLHPEWQHEFLKQIIAISDVEAKKNHILLSSHSASTLAPLKDELISLFEFDGTKVRVSKVKKAEIIRSLSAGLITFSEREARLSIHHVLESTTGPVLFTEGMSDVMILETAWEKLYPQEECSIVIQSAFDCSFLGNLLRRDDIFRDHPDRRFFGLFDFDEAYNIWNGCNGAEIETDPSKGLVKRLNNSGAYAMLLPVPENDAIKRQVINNNTGRTYEGRSLLTIELLFYGDPQLAVWFKPDTSRPGDFIKFSGDKVKFARDIVPTLGPGSFESFRPILDFVRSNSALQA